MLSFEETMTYTKNGKTYHCTVEAALDSIGGTWKPLILRALGDQVMQKAISARYFGHTIRIKYQHS